MCKSVCEAQHVQVCLHIVLSVSLTSLQGLLRLPKAEVPLWEKIQGPLNVLSIIASIETSVTFRWNKQRKLLYES